VGLLDRRLVAHQHRADRQAADGERSERRGLDRGLQSSGRAGKPQKRKSDALRLQSAHRARRRCQENRVARLGSRHGLAGPGSGLNDHDRIHGQQRALTRQYPQVDIRQSYKLD
jgi:hypothetical protein